MVFVFIRFCFFLSFFLNLRQSKVAGAELLCQSDKISHSSSYSAVVAGASGFDAIHENADALPNGLLAVLGTADDFPVS